LRPAGFAGAVNANGSTFNGTGFTVTNPSTGEYEIVLPTATFGTCAAASEVPDTTVSPYSEGNPVFADVTVHCTTSKPRVIVKIYASPSTPTENGFAFISQAG
jgi:hypothetical protein